MYLTVGCVCVVSVPSDHPKSLKMNDTIKKLLEDGKLKTSQITVKLIKDDGADQVQEEHGGAVHDQDAGNSPTTHHEGKL